MRRKQPKFHRLKTRIVILPFGKPPKSAEFLKRYYSLVKRNRGFFDRLIDPVVSWAFMLWCPFRCVDVALSHKKDLAWATAAMRYTFRNFVEPLEVSLFDLKDDDSRRYIRRFELAGVMKAINPAGWRPECRLNNKQAFYDYCAARSLPIPKTYAIVNRGAVEQADGSNPSSDLIIKPVWGRSGTGVRIARFKDGKFVLSDQERPFSYDELLAHLAAQEKSEIVVSQRIVNHPDMAGLAMDALATLRLTTCLNESGRSELVTSVLRMPTEPGVLVDNIKAGGIIAPVDPDAGRLGAAKGGKRPGAWTRHPASGAPIEGVTLPHWRATRDLVVNAHDAAFADYTVVGWDVAIAADGPCLIEGNSKPCVIIAQRGPGKGLGDQRFGALIAYHLDRIAAQGAA